MIRAITGFRQDDHGDWVADLSCLHSQHVRHRPPFQERPWVVTAEGRASRMGGDIDCPLCDRAELPDGLQLARTAGPFDADTVPSGLRKTHYVAVATWGRLRVIEGSVDFTVATEPTIDAHLHAGDVQPIPPQVAHHLTLCGPVVLAVDFLNRKGEPGAG